MNGTRARGLRVLIIPHYGERNPYISLLQSALSEAGVKVELARWTRPASLWRALRRSGRPDVVHLQWQHRFFLSPSGRAGPSVGRTIMFFMQWLALRAVGTRFVWTVHNVVNHEKRLVAWEMSANRVLARCVDGIVIHCEEVREEVAAAYRIEPTKLHVVPHGHFGTWYPPEVDRDEARRELGLPPAVKVFLFFGFIRTYKGVDSLIDTFRQIPDPTLRLLIVGRPRNSGLATSITKRSTRDPRVTTLLEFVEDQTLMTYLGACDAVVLPYTDSLTSGAAVLAASSGRAVVLPSMGCARSFPPSAAITYDPTDDHGLRTALQAAAIAPLEEMGNAAREHVRQHTWQVTARKLLMVYAGASGLRQIEALGDGPPP